MADGENPRATTKRYRPRDFELSVRRSTAGRGLFADERIPKGACVIEYVGNLISEEEYRASRSSYLFDIGPKGALDGFPYWNRARYINHSCAPNCDTAVRKRRVFIHALRDIEPGEELTYDYGSDYFDEYIAKACRCIKCMPNSHAKAGRGNG